MNDRNSKYDRRLMCSRTTSAIERALWRIEATSGAEVMHAADENRADQNPDQRRQPAERQPGQNRPDDRSGGGDGRKMLRHERRRVERLEIEAVLQLVGRRFAFGDRAETGGQQPSVGEIGDRAG